VTVPHGVVAVEISPVLDYKRVLCKFDINTESTYGVTVFVLLIILRRDLLWFEVCLAVIMPF